MGLKIPWQQRKKPEHAVATPDMGILELGTEEAPELMMKLFPLCSS
jgi:hypothetical protein